MRFKLLTTRNAALAILSVLLAMCLAFGIILLPKTALADETDPAVSQWDGDLEAAGWADTEDGEQAVAPDTYVLGENTLTLGSAEALAYFAHQVYIGAHDGFKGYTVTLGCDIDLQGNLWIPIGWTSLRTAPGANNLFKGTFDGGKHTISGLSTEKFNDTLNVQDEKLYVTYKDTSIEVPADVSEYNGKDADSEKIALYSYGLFGITGNTTIKNLTVKDVNITVADKTVGKLTIKAEGAAALVGMSIGNITVENCIAGSENGNDKVERPADDDAVGNGYPIALGGVVGMAYAGLKDGEPYGDLPNDKYTHEIASLYPPIYGKFIDGYYWGDITFENCINYVNITDKQTANDGDWHQTGGILGHMQEESKVTFNKCENHGDIYAPNASAAGMTGAGSARWTTGAVTGDTNGVKVENKVSITYCTNYGNITGKANAAGGLTGSFDSYWADSDDVSYALEIKHCENYGDITSPAAAGGIAGYVESFTDVNTSIVITDCFNYGAVRLSSSTGTCGGLIGSLSYNIQSREPYPITISGGNYGEVEVDKCTDTNTRIAASCVPFRSNIQQALYINQLWNVLYLVGEGGADKHGLFKYPKVTDETAEATLIYADEEQTIVSGVEVTNSGTYQITIPAKVTEIASCAFVGQEGLTAVNFEENSQLTKIGKWAFAGTSIKQIELPASVVSIGTAAFVDCGKPYVIAADADHYSELLQDDIKDLLTYEVKVTYYYNGEEVENSATVRLFNQSYTIYKNNDGVWGANNLSDDSEANGPAINEAPVLWYDNAEVKGEYLTVGNVTDLLKIMNVTEISLYSVVREEGQLVFVARNDIVYDKDTSYTVNDINKLLVSASDKLTTSMTASITAFNGETENLPNVIHNAGVYEISVEYAGNTFTFELTVQQATFDLSVYENLSWNAGGSELQNNILYLYDYAGSTDKYPSTQLLTAAQIADLKLSGSYQVISVTRSVVRNRDGGVTLAISGAEGVFADVEYVAGATQSGVGIYTTVVELTPNANYAFSAGSVDTLRGMTISIDENGVAVITKVWYMVDVSNWLTNVNGGEEGYAINDFVFRGTVNLPAPALHFSGEGGEMQFTLAGDNGVNIVFDSSESYYGFATAFNYYVNNTMPVGNYTLTISVGEVITTDENTNEKISHNGFTERFVFSVIPATISGLDGLNTALKGVEFVYEADGNSHLYGSSASSAVNAVINSPLLARQGVWTESEYADYYSASFEISYNLARAFTDEYTETVNTSGADTYTVYYKISALNYYSSIDNLKDETRYDYYFTVVNVATVSLPVIDHKIYTGYALTADITDGQYFTVTANAGGTNVTAAGYDVVLTLRDDVHYMWEGDTLDNRKAAVTVKFFIDKAANDWTVATNVIGWEYNGYDIKTNLFMGAVVGGTVTFSVLKDGKAVTGLESFTEVNGELAKVLNGLPAGAYTVNATVTADGNHTDLAVQTVEFNVAKAVNDWKDSFDVISWSYGGYDKEVNRIMGTVISGEVTFSVKKDGTAVAGLESFTEVNDTIAGILGGLPAGTYTVTAKVAVDGNHNAVADGSATLTIATAVNAWAETPSIITWVKGEYNAEENVITASDVFGSLVDYEIYETENEENVIYKVANGEVVIDKLAEAGVGHYTLKAVVNATANYGGLEKTFTFQIFAPEGLAWWAWLLIIVGILGVIALVFFILHEKGVLQMLTGRFVIAMRTKMTVDATIAAVRANMVAEKSKKTRAEAEARERLEEMKKAREEAKSKPIDEQAAALEDRAQAAAEKAEKMRKYAEKIQKKAEAMKTQGSAETGEGEAPSEEVQTQEAQPEESSGENDSTDEQ